MRKQIVTITLVFCVALLLTSCSGYVRVDIRPTLRGTVAVGPVGQDRCFPVQYANVYTSDGYRRYDAYYAYSADEYRFPSLTPGYYDVEVETLLGSRSIPLHYPTDYYFHQNWLPPGYRDDDFAELAGMRYYVQKDGDLEEKRRPLMRWNYGTVRVYINDRWLSDMIWPILQEWERDVFSYYSYYPSDPVIGPCIRFLEASSEQDADLIFIYTSNLSSDVEGITYHTNGYFTKSIVYMRKDTKTICNYAVAQAMGMGTSSYQYSVLHWEPLANQNDRLTDYEKGYARMMYSIAPGLEPYYPTGMASFMQTDSPLFIDFQMKQTLGSDSFEF